MLLLSFAKPIIMHVLFSICWGNFTNVASEGFK